MIGASLNTTGISLRRSAARSVPAFSAFAPNPKTYKMEGVLRGIGAIAVSQTSGRHVKDYQDVYQLISSGEIAWHGARYVGGVAYASDASGYPLPEMPWASGAPAATNAFTESANLASSDWSKNNAVCTFDQIGLDGLPNTASVLGDDASGGNGSVYAQQSLTVTSTEPNCLVAYLKKKQLSWALLGPASLDSSMFTYFDLDNGATGGDTADDSEIIDLGNEIYKCIVQFSSVTDLNGTVRLRPIEVDGVLTVDLDGTSNIYVLNLELHKGKTIAEVRGLPPILTTTIPVDIEADGLSADITNHANNQGAVYFEYMPTFSTAEVSSNLEILSPAAAPGLIYYDGTTGEFKSTDGTNTITKVQTLTAGTAYKIGLIYDADDSKMRLCVDGDWGTEGNYDGAYTLGSILSFFRNATYLAKMRDLRIYDVAGSAAQQAKIDSLMP